MVFVTFVSFADAARSIDEKRARLWEEGFDRPAEALEPLVAVERALICISYIYIFIYSFIYIYRC